MGSLMRLYLARGVDQLPHSSESRYVSETIALLFFASWQFPSLQVKAATMKAPKRSDGENQELYLDNPN